MIIIQPNAISDAVQCPYIKEKECMFEYFFASGLDELELDEYLNCGWRKFGYYYFRPACKDCYECIPIRVLVKEFSPTKSQRRILNKNKDIEVKFSELEYSTEIYDIYKEHSLHRFNMEASPDEFIYNFYFQSCPSFQSEYYLNGKLLAVGFLDKTHKGLSSIYFIYRTEYSKYSPGNFSILTEIEYSRQLGLDYYYLGYYIGNNHYMAYKNKFHPYEKYNWEQKKWLYQGKNLKKG